MADIFKEHSEIEGTKILKQKQEKKEKYENAIKALEEQLDKAKKPGAFRNTIEKKAKIKELTDKIDKFKDLLKNLK
jgi:molecular chaperone DnaK (HSP70)